ncbi:MAG TPA: protein kinase [Terriglobales bacterium]|nr:protein kinase [Terriglobales bacterium]
MHQQLKVGQYILEQKLGEGGMAEVWKARHVHLGSIAAIKFLLPRLAGDPELEDRFLSEGKRQARLQHKNIVPAIDFLQIDGRSYLIMQYVEGTSLETKLLERNGPLSREEVRTISSDVLSALDYAHSLGVVHRDVKPSNILLDKQGRASLSDFGIALALGEDRRITRTGVAVGTPDYMSPEQIIRPKAVDARSDIYSFGCVLYAMLTGSPPFGMDGTTEFYVKDCHVRTTPLPPVQRNPAISPAVGKVVLQCLEKDPEKRFQTCGSVITALDVIAGMEDQKQVEREVGQYLLEEKLGEGGMAEVWKARHQVLGTDVAVKFLSARLAGIPDVEQRFLGEGKRQAQLQHPNIVSAYDFLHINERSYLIMRFIEGQNLDEWLFKAQAPLAIAQALAISTDVLSALGYAHSRNVVHRDVKPSNILIENTGRAFVMDFGIALVLGEERATRIGSAIGTPDFMSPEQIVGARNIDCRSDIYSFGCMLYQMLTQRLPFEAKEGDGDSEYVIKDKHLRQKPGSLRELNPNIPEHIDRAVLRCLEKNASDRFGSCEELLVALTQGSIQPTAARADSNGSPTDSPLPARPSAAPIEPTTAPASISAVPTTSIGMAPPKRSRILLWTVVVLLALALLGGGLYRYKHQQLDQVPTQVAVAAPVRSPEVRPEETKPDPQPTPPEETVKPDEQPAQELNPPPVVLPPVPKKHQKPAQTKAIPAPVSAPEQDAPQAESPSVAPPVESPSLSGSWQGEYNHPATKQSYKVSLQLSEGATDVLTGILIFDPDGSNASSCSLTGHYNPQTKFMLLIIGTCHGSPPEYLQGKIGFGSVDPSDRRVMGVDQMHDGVLSISR